MESGTVTKGSNAKGTTKKAVASPSKTAAKNPAPVKKTAPAKKAPAKKATAGKTAPVKKSVKSGSSPEQVIPKATIKKMVMKNVKDDKMRISKEIYDELNKVIDQLMHKDWECIQSRLEKSSPSRKTVKVEDLECFENFNTKHKLKDAKVDEKNFVIAKAVFQRKTRSLGGKDKKFLFSKDFLLYYQAYIEAEVSALLDEVISAASHAKRVTIKTQDVDMVQKILNKS